MGKKSRSRTIRTMISVPSELKRRMAKVKDQVNWSAVACHAFESRLSEMEERRKVEDMKDVISRLRATRQLGVTEACQAGFQAGRVWAMEEADAGELKRLHALYRSMEHERVYGWEFYFSGEGHWPGGYSVRQRLYLELRPDDRDLTCEQEYWESVVGDEQHVLDDGAWLRGFCEGALDVWWEVMDQL